MRSQGSYAFVANLRALRDSISFRLAKGHVLRRAMANEIAVIKGTLQSLVPVPYLFRKHFWECRLPHAGGKVELLPENEWRYFVVAFRGPNDTLSELQTAFDLAAVELEVILTVVSGTATVWHPAELLHFLDEAKHDSIEIGPSQIAEIVTLHAQLQHHDSHLLDLKRLLAQLRHLKGLPYQSPLRFLGYFAILEAVLTHQPKPTDPYDSITRQVQKKLNLLDHRWPHPIDYGPFGGVDPQKFWARMYAYRSTLAHGGVPTFTGEMAVLKSHQDALRLLKETTKAVLRQALNEPRLLVDLQQC